jgi:RNA-binding protein YlmH
MTEKRLAELSRRGHCCSDFMTLEEQSLYCSLCKRPGFRPGFLDGGYPEAERKLVSFDLTESPILLIEIRVQGRLLTGKPGHRDYLGALMGLGIKRETLGDVLVFPEGAGAWVFCLRRMGEYILNTLDAAGRFPVKCAIIEKLPPEAVVPGERVRLTLSSVRLDGLIASAFPVSRGQSAEFIRSGLVFIDGETVKKPDFVPKPGCKITVRGMGRFWLREVPGKTKKDRIAVVIEK